MLEISSCTTGVRQNAAIITNDTNIALSCEQYNHHHTQMSVEIPLSNGKYQAAQALFLIKLTKLIEIRYFVLFFWL